MERAGRRPMKRAFPAALILALAGPAFAQRGAMSPALSAEAAASVFQDAVVSTCIPAAAGGAGVNALPIAARAKVQASGDAGTRKQLGAAADETVWDVVSGRGAVTIREKAGRCVVSVYGPPVVTTILSTAQGLSGSAGFEKLVGAPPPNGFGQSLMKIENGRRLLVQLDGSEPGMPGHKSRFSVVTATVFASPAG
jgi:hypothetical protein